MVEQLSGDLYDHPLYYDLVFGSDWKAEFRFLQSCFDKHAGCEVERVFEPACGTGRLLFRLARAGFHVAGLDLNPHAVEFCNDRLVRKGFEPTVFVGDMTDFQLDDPVDAAFNMINSFRHLQTEKQATDHLRCVADALNPGGIYVLGLHLTPTQGEPDEEESWSARRGNLCVNTHMWVIYRDLQTRQERLGMTMDVLTPTQSLRWEDEIIFRTYTLSEFQQLLERVPQLEVAETYDFSYRIRRPIELDGATEDVVYVLRKK